jgi:hypothetical protein
MTRTLPTALGKLELIPERPFTHTDHVSKDREVLVHMAKQARSVLEKHTETLGENETVFIEEQDERYHRFFVTRPGTLSQARDLYLVGFFSHKQERAAADHFGDLDDQLVKQIPTYQKILSYSTMALPNGDFGNLVLLTDEETKLKWMQGEIHNQAIALAPGYYQFVRINNGVLPDGVLQPDALQITQVKYYDYEEDPPWKAVRKFV